MTKCGNPENRYEFKQEVTEVTEAQEVGLETGLLRLTPARPGLAVAGFAALHRICCPSHRALFRASPLRFREIWSGPARKAAGPGVRHASEIRLQGGSCQSGDWNIALKPAAWERMLDALPAPCPVGAARPAPSTARTLASGGTSLRSTEFMDPGDPRSTTCPDSATRTGGKSSASCGPPVTAAAWISRAGTMRFTRASGIMKDSIRRCITGKTAGPNKRTIVSDSNGRTRFLKLSRGTRIPGNPGLTAPSDWSL